MPHFEIPASDIDAAKAFHSGLFGWDFTPMPGGEAAQYHLASGDGVEPGTMTFEVDDRDARYDWAMANDGAEALPPTDFPGIGRFACVEDDQGNIVGMIAPADEGN